MLSSTSQTIILAAGILASLLGGGRPAAATPPGELLVFEGTVVSIGQVERELTPWLITMKVKKVVSGAFSEPTFSFAVHSPARSGLAKGRSYTVKAIWRDGGYAVDELQWHHAKQGG